MFFLLELLLWLGLPLVVGLASGLTGHLRKAVRGLFYPAMNRQMSRLQFLTRLALLGMPLAYLAAAVLGAWFGARQLALLSLATTASLACGAVWCGQRMEQMVKLLQVRKHESINVEHHD